MNDEGDMHCHPLFFQRVHGDGYVASVRSKTPALCLPKKAPRESGAQGGSGSARSILTGEHDREHAIGRLRLVTSLGGVI
jgi:hypothetical protein